MSADMYVPNGKSYLDTWRANQTTAGAEAEMRPDAVCLLCVANGASGAVIARHTHRAGRRKRLHARGRQRDAVPIICTT